MGLLMIIQRFPIRVYVGAALLIAAAVGWAKERPSQEKDKLSPERIEQIASMLEKGHGLPGRPISDRATWGRLASNPAYAAMVIKAEPLLQAPLPDLPDELFLDFSRTGNRDRWQRVDGTRRSRLVPLVLAECVENKGRFLPALQDLITTLCAERTWVLPAHDSKLVEFYGKERHIDLASSALAGEFAMTDRLLGEKLTTEVRALLRENVKRRVVEPYQAMIRGQREGDWWLIGTNNWNAVCLAGVTAAALGVLDSPRERAEVIAAAEHYSRYFLSGFTPDGYCSEGLGYWAYGFGRFVLLSETIREATGGALDLLSLPEAQMPARFGARIQITNRISPAFADCSVSAQAPNPPLWLANRRFGLGLNEYQTLDWRATLATLGEAMVFAFPAQDKTAPRSAGSAAEGIRTWFDKAGVLICRYEPGSKTRMAVALKGGNNNEHHNHNDLGSYVVVCGKQLLLADPGGETYTARTFSPRRYESKLLNSYGHAVPVVGGKLQSTGAKAHARVMETSFTTSSDSLRMDISSAYNCKPLKKLERFFCYSREGKGSLTIADSVSFDSPQSFETALITLGKFEKVNATTLRVSTGNEKVRVTIDAGGQAFEVKSETIHENASQHPTRIAVALSRPVTSATVTMKVEPEP